ncbi:hypothetical protein M4V62_01525 [Streptomyces durmitorensis]|uniref:DUF4303 domain-containing protein n=1 Tax=Streptomyces durmitorensis TaxID=319947 RepID=A0ABY4PL42_9ACTN|nr:hypothetical protein [Streptomyces durmitorensis]UQT53860.1 hypothetical protein M4V62_01525 [Streptomyces durmitorensis]
MTTFRRHMEQMALRTLGEFPDELISDIYVVTFRIDSVDQDPRHPYVAIGYNTETGVARQLAETGSSEPWEARWNYAYFPPSGLEGIRIVGHHPEHDPVGADLYRREAVVQDLWYEDEDDLSEQEQDERDEQLAEHFNTLCVDLARQLHADGRLVGVFGRPLPVILYNMFDPDEMFALTAAANPPELVTEFMSEDPGAQPQA